MSRGGGFGRLEEDVRRHGSLADEQARAVRRLAQEDVVIEGDRQLKLRSPNGTYWGVVVDDAGNFSSVNLGTEL